MPSSKIKHPAVSLKKTPTGISGFDEITQGGLPQGRPTLVCGAAGCGKSLFAAEFLFRGAVEHGEPGVLMTFEESADDIRKNVASLGFDVDRLVKQKKIVVDHVYVDRSQIEENGEYDLDGLFIRLDHAVNSIGAKRVVLDTIESLFSGFTNQVLLRSELRRLFGWLKDRKLTAVITGERGEGSLTRQGLEEYVSDCVILLDHRVTGQVSTRRLRVVKYRGSTHGTNEYPFLIDEEGISVLPLTSSTMDYAVSGERISTGVPELDDMLGGQGLYRGSTVLLSGTAGTGKTTMASLLADETCRRKERCLYFSFEESRDQIIRNMHSVSLDLDRHVRSGLLGFHSSRPTMLGLEMHLVRMNKLIEEFKPSVVIIDPISNLRAAGTVEDSANVMIRLIDSLRRRNITGFFTCLTHLGNSPETTDEGMSSIVDTWMLVRDLESNGERNRAFYVLKSRGMAHSNQVREFVINHRGVHLIPAYIGAGGVVTGSARVSQEAAETAGRLREDEELLRQQMTIEHRRAAVEAQIEALRAGFKAEEQELGRSLTSQQERIQRLDHDRRTMEKRRSSDRKK